MTKTLFLIILACLFLSISCVLSTSLVEKEITKEDAKKYLVQFGYINSSDTESTESNFPRIFSHAPNALGEGIKKFQEFFGLPVTGMLDAATKKLMMRPRCGLPDIVNFATNPHGGKWQKGVMTYSIENFSPNFSRDEVREGMRKAFEVWANVIPLDFKEVDKGGDITVKFVYGEHNGCSRFDGPNGVLAHASLRQNADHDLYVHFDESEAWCYLDPNGLNRGKVDFLTIAVHEIGHILGMQHQSSGGLMDPTYTAPLDKSGNYMVPKLNDHEIKVIQRMYGKRNADSKPRQNPEPESPWLEWGSRFKSWSSWQEWAQSSWKEWSQSSWQEWSQPSWKEWAQPSWKEWPQSSWKEWAQPSWQEWPSSTPRFRRWRYL